jgi:hypothetical protein
MARGVPFGAIGEPNCALIHAAFQQRGGAQPLGLNAFARTILREAREALDRHADNGEVILDSLYVLEKTMKYFFMQAELCAHAGKNKEIVDRDYLNAAAIAEKVAPYRHARLSAVKLAGDPNNPARFKDDATADELRAEIIRRLGHLVSAGVIDLRALPVPKLVV